MKKYLVIAFLLMHSIINGVEVETNSPLSNLSTANLSSDNQIIFDSYDEIEFQSFEKDVKHIKFMGNVKVRFQDKTIKSRVLIVTMISNKVIEISGFDNVELRDKNSVYLADKVAIDPEKKIGVLYNVRSYLNDVLRSGDVITTTRGLFFEAEKATILSEERVVLENAYFTFTDIEPPPYFIFSKKVWYFKGEIIFALFDAYYVGQNLFLPLPFYFRWEKFTGIRSSFGQEKRIGWYLMNTLDFSPEHGNYTLYLDFYEKLGQYMMLYFANKKPLPPFNTLNVKFYGANDQRVVYDPANDRYSRNIIMEDGSTTNISQLSWNYQINAVIKKDALNISILWEDINDPYFKHKFTTRRESFDIRHILQPQDNSFYGSYRGSLDATAQSYSRSFLINFYTLSISGKWNFGVTENPEFNRYLNERYRYYLQSLSLPVISYSLDNIEIFKAEYSIPIEKTTLLSPTSVPDSTLSGVNTNSTTTTTKQPESQTNTYFANYTNENVGSDTNSSNTKISSITSNSNSQVQRNITNIVDKTSSYTLYKISSYISGNFGYDSIENFDTNRNPTSDGYTHRESGKLGLNGNFLNNLITMDDSLSFENVKKWATDPVVNSNYMRISGYSLILNSSTSLQLSPGFYKDEWYEFSFPLSLSHSFTHELVKTTTDLPLTSAHTTSFNTSLIFFNDQIKNEFTVSHFIKYRLTNIDDIYLNNTIERNLYFKNKVQLFYFYSKYWFGIETETKLDILDTKTNTEENRVKWSFPEITNRIVSGYSPKLKISFTPSANFNPLPAIYYVYDILRNTNESLSISSTYSINDIYEFIFYRIEIFRFNAYLYWDFLNPRKDLFTLDFSSVIWFDPYWKLLFTTSVRNDKIYRYIRDFNPPDKDFTHTDFWGNLLDSINIFDYNALKRGYFKVQRLSFILTHYILEEWQLDISFNIERRVDTARLIAYWEPTLLITFVLRGTSEQFPPYKKTFLPENYQ